MYLDANKYWYNLWRMVYHFNKKEKLFSCPPCVSGVSRKEKIKNDFFSDYLSSLSGISAFLCLMLTPCFIK